MRSKLPFLLFTFFWLSILDVQAQSKTSPKTFLRTEFFNTNLFIENKGQFKGKNNISEDILYALENGDDQVYFTRSGIYLSLTKVVPPVLSKTEEHELEKNGEAFAEEEIRKRTKTYISLVKAEWNGANASVTIEPEKHGEGYFSFGGPELKSKGYKKLIYKDVYPGIDVEYIVPKDKGGIKYTIIVHPGADPSKIELEYKGSDILKTEIKNKNIIIHTPAGNITEHAPQSFDDENKKVGSSFILTGNKISYKLSEYNRSRTLFIDPWLTAITVLPPNNCGYEIDYDDKGNVYVSGGGAVIGGVNSLVAKYDSAGNWLWTFPGSLSSPAWNAGGSEYLPGTMTVDKKSGKVYLAECFKMTGIRIIRLKSDGTYDNFISTPNPLFRESWRLRFHCTKDQLICFGGSTNSSYNIAFIDTLTGSMSLNAITSSSFIYQQDVIDAAIDGQGKMFCMLADAKLGAGSINNYIFQINNSGSGYVWSKYNQDGAFVEAQNALYIRARPSPSGNAFSSLSVNDNYLFMYTGKFLRAFNKTTGNTVGTMYNFTSHNPLWQAGIAIDDCNNIYIGGRQGTIHVRNFTGSSFNSLPSIVLSGFPDPDGIITDIKLNKDRNLLYVCGKGFIATVIPNASCNNSTINDSIHVSVSTNCASPNTASANVFTTESSPRFYYIWKDITGTVIQSSQTTSTTNSISGLASGANYTLEVYLNYDCSQVNDIVSFIMTTSTPTPLAQSDSIICFNDSIHLFSNTIPGATYLWMGPNGFTSSLQNPIILNADSEMEGNYTLTASIAGCVSEITSTNVNISGNKPNFGYSSAIFCQTGSDPSPVFGINDTAGVFNSTPSGLVIDSLLGIINLDASIPGNYIVSNTLSATTSCPSISFDTSVTVIPAPSAGFSFSAPFYCSNEEDVTPTMAMGATQGVFSASPAGIVFSGTTAQIDLSTSDPGTYMIYNTLASSGGCAEVIDSAAFNLYAKPVASINGIDHVCLGDTLILTATGGDNYNWNTGQTNTSISIHPLVDTPYSVVVADSNNCIDTATILIEVHNLPSITLNLGSTGTVCIYADAVPLNASPSGGTFSGNGVIGNFFYPNIAGLDSQIIDYTYTDIYGCTGSASGSIYVDECTGITEFNNAHQIKIIPNPFSEYTTLSYYLSKNETVQIELYNSLGQLVEKILSPDQAIGWHTQNIGEEKEFTPGVCLLRITIGNQTFTKRIVHSD